MEDGENMKDNTSSALMEDDEDVKDNTEICAFGPSIIKSDSNFSEEIEENASQKAETRHRCTTCGEVYKFKGHLNRHMKTHTSTLSKPLFQCGDCDMRYRKKESLVTHMRLRHTGERPYSCTQCDETFVSSSYLWKHLNTKHCDCNPCIGWPFHSDHCEIVENTSQKAETRHRCTTCGKDYKSKGHLNRHVKTHTSTLSKPLFQCGDCDMRFREKASLVTHMRLRHTGERPYACAQCEETFVSSSYLLKHVKAKHCDYDPSIGRPFHCDHCGKRFREKSHLKEHLMCHLSAAARQEIRALEVMLHIEELTCTACDKVFSKKKSLYRHVNDVHKRVRDFRCDTCGASYGRKYLLEDHMKKCMNLKSAALRRRKRARPSEGQTRSTNHTDDVYQEESHKEVDLTVKQEAEDGSQLDDFNPERTINEALSRCVTCQPPSPPAEPGWNQAASPGNAHENLSSDEIDSIDIDRDRSEQPVHQSQIKREESLDFQQNTDGDFTSQTANFVTHWNVSEDGTLIKHEK